MKKILKNDPAYPPLLRNIKSPPEYLFILGDLPPEDAPTIAVVGARHCTEYGQRVAYEISSALAAAGVIIVSGLASGIDQVAHAQHSRHTAKRSPCLAVGLINSPPRHKNVLQNAFSSTKGPS